MSWARRCQASFPVPVTGLVIRMQYLKTFGCSTQYRSDFGAGKAFEKKNNMLWGVQGVLWSSLHF